MESQPVTIPPRRSLVLFAILAIFMVFLSYLFILVLAVACVYLPWLVVTNVANFNTLVLFLGGIAVAGVMLWSLIPQRDKFEAPGLLLEPTSHPRLFTEIQGIAAALHEPVPRYVYLIGDPNAWVADRGGFMGIGSRRVMGLGLPLLAALNVSQFRAILAHEFAHYYGGDTSLGPWLHRTQMAMIRTFQGIGSIGEMRLPAVVAILYTVVFGILKFYWLLFLRAINFVSRKQEYRADELACIVAGPVSLISGLRRVHASALAWSAYWRTEVAPMLGSGCLPSITGGFSQFLSAPSIAKDVQTGLEAQIRDAKTEPYDSHPPLRDRIDAAKLLTVPSPPDDRQPAWSLLDDMDDAELKFLEALNPDLPKNSLKRVAWEESASRVLVPSWFKTVYEYAPLLEGITAGNLVKSLGKVPDIAAQMRDPKGMLLTPQQRIPYARNLVATAFALALATNGWTIHSSPGEFYLEKNGEKLEPFQLIVQLSDGVIWNEAWTEMCQKYGIEDLQFVPTPRAANASTQDGALPSG
jgi:heat shock protein HtpX